MDLETALSDVEQRLAERSRVRDAKQAEVAELDTEIEDLNLERRGLQLAATRHGVQPMRQVQDESAVEWTNLHRTDAIERVLALSPHPMSPDQIARSLRGLGRTEENPRAISAALNHLKEYQRVRSVGRGQWIGNVDKGAAADPQPDALVDVPGFPALNGSGPPELTGVG